MPRNKGSKGLYVNIAAKRKRIAEGSGEKMRKKGAKTARVSGWCAFSEWALRSVDAGFPISDHSDFSGTMKFVEECNPKQVYTVHG